MEGKEIERLKNEFAFDISRLRHEQERFKKRVCVITNIFIPGIGFFIYGKSFIKGSISLALFFLYNFYIFNELIAEISGSQEALHISSIITAYIPAIIISLVSTMLVSLLEED